MSKITAKKHKKTKKSKDALWHVSTNSCVFCELTSSNLRFLGEKISGKKKASKARTELILEAIQEVGRELVACKQKARH